MKRRGEHKEEEEGERTRKKLLRMKHLLPVEAKSERKEERERGGGRQRKEITQTRMGKESEKEGKKIGRERERMREKIVANCQTPSMHKELMGYIYKTGYNLL